MSYFYAFLCAYLFSLLFVHLAVKKNKTKKLISCMGGIGIYGAFLIAILAAFLLKELYGSKLLGLIISSVLIFILGLVDDLNDLRPSVKITGEILGIVILIFFGIAIKIAFLPIWVNILITILWVILITNAFNLLDIMDGLASGLIIIISLTLLCIAFINRDFFSSFILIALIGAHLGFLKYNYPPAKIYMGDAGSLVSGFLLAVVSINISYAPLDRPIALITPILALSLPIYDTFFLIIMRIKKHKPVFSKTNDHFALRLVTTGLSVRKSVWIMYVFSMFLAVSSLIAAYSSNITGLVMLIVVILVFILMGKKAGIVKIDDKK